MLNSMDAYANTWIEDQTHAGRDFAQAMPVCVEVEVATGCVDDWPKYQFYLYQYQRLELEAATLDREISTGAV